MLIKHILTTWQCKDSLKIITMNYLQGIAPGKNERFAGKQTLIIFTVRTYAGGRAYTTTATIMYR